MNLTIEQRDRLRAILPQYEQKSTGRKRADTVQVFEGILWLLTCGARWEDIDKKLIRKSTPRSRPVTATFSNGSPLACSHRRVRPFER